jgi:outer membrane protein assembly factor BamB
MRWPPRVMPVLLGVVLLVGACQWPTVGFDAARTGFSPSEKAITPANVHKLTPVWKAKLIGPGSDAVVADGRVYVSAVENNIPIGAKVGSYLYAFNATAASCPQPGGCQPVWSHPYATVATTPPSPTVLTPPVLKGGTVYVGWNRIGPDQYGGAVDAFADDTGTPVFSSGQGGTSSAAVTRGLLYSNWQFRCCMGDRFSATEALDAKTGTPRFSTFIAPTSAPALAGGTLYVAQGATISAYDAAGAGNCGPPPPPAPPNFLGFTVVCSPLWSARAGGTITATPAVANGEVYVGASDGKLYAFPAGGCGAATCTPTWTGSTGGPITSAAAVSAATVWVASGDGKLYAFNAQGCGAPTCVPTWTAVIGGTLSPPSVAGSVLFIASSNGHLYAYNASGCGQATCQAALAANIGAPVATSPAISNGRVFITDTIHTLHAYTLP